MGAIRIKKRGVIIFIVLLLLFTPILGCENRVINSNKISEDLLTYLNASTDTPPNMINKDDTWNVRVVCDKQVGYSICENIIGEYGVIEGKPWENSFDVRIQKDRITKLAEEPSISFIGESYGDPVAKCSLTKSA